MRRDLLLTNLPLPILSLIAGIFCLVEPAALLAQLPNSPVGSRGNALIAVLKGGPDAVDATFMRDNFADSYLADGGLEARRTALADWVEKLGELDIRGVRKTEEFAATLMGSSADDRDIEISWEVAGEPPHKIVGLEIHQADTKRASMTQAAALAAATAHIEEQVGAGAFSGTVLLAKGEEILLHEAHGLASRRYGVANRTDTAFNLGSINKIFTQVALAQLARDGKLSFDDTIADHLTDYPNPEVAAKVTINQVRNHTAGLGDIFTDAFDAAAKSTFQKPADYFPLFANEPLLFEPGTSQRYSNGGYMVLGAIIEAASGVSYEEYVQTHVFEPSGMTGTGSIPLDEPRPNVATGYTRHGGLEKWHENSFLIPFTGTPAGGGYSTAEDLLAFRHAFTEHRLLSPRYTAWVLSGELPEEDPPAGSEPGIGIAGGGAGVNAELEIHGPYTLIVLSNFDPPAASEVSRFISDLLGSIED